MKRNPRQIHIHDDSGRVIYNRLWDSGSEALRFDVYGFVTRRDVVRNRWTICEGWCGRDEDGFVCPRAA